MAKITDYNEVKQMVTELYDGQEWTAKGYLADEDVILFVTMAYLAHDTNKAYAMDFEEGISLIASKKRISVIGMLTSSFYQLTEDLVDYISLEADIECILTVLDVAFMRWQYNLD